MVGTSTNVVTDTRLSIPGMYSVIRIWKYNDHSPLWNRIEEDTLNMPIGATDISLRLV